MRRSWSTNQHVNRLGLKSSTILSCWQIAAVTLLGVILAIKTQPKIISPLSDNPIIPPAYAVENTPRYDVPALIRQIAGRHAGVLLRIGKCESGYRQNAISHTGDYGVMQINLNAHWSRVPGHTKEAKIQWLLDPRNNILFGYNLYLQDGTRPWRASRKCSGV